MSFLFCWLSGYNTRWVQAILPDVFPAESAVEGAGGPTTRLVTVFFGANDACLPAVNERQHVPLAEFKQNLTAIVAHVRASCPQAAVVLLTPPPIDDVKIEANFVPGSRSNQSAGEYAAAVKAVAMEMGAPCVDLWAGLQAHPNWQEFLNDGIHLSPTGNALVAELLFAVFETEVPALHVTACPHTGSFANSSSRSSAALLQDAPWHDDVRTSDGFLAALAKAPAHDRRA
jgi:lysophospholipase L1-like esterase